MIPSLRRQSFSKRNWLIGGSKCREQSRTVGNSQDQPATVRVNEEMPEKAGTNGNSQDMS